MIPTQDIVAWGKVVPWADQRQVEQDLLIGRALVEIFSDDMLRDVVRVHGGTGQQFLRRENGPAAPASSMTQHFETAQSKRAPFTVQPHDAVT